MKNHTLIALALLALGTSCATAADQVSIRGTVRTTDKTRGKEIAVGRHSVQSGSRSQVLELEVKAVQPSAATNVRVSWVVLVDPPRGKPERVVARGEQFTNLTRTVVTKLESESFTTVERDVQHRGKVTEVESEVGAWGVRIEDLQGNVLGERIEPERQTDRIHELWAAHKLGR